MQSPKYPTLTKKGFLTKRGHDLDKNLIEFLNEVISQMPHGLPLNSKIRGLYAQDLYMQTYEGQASPQLPFAESISKETLRRNLFEWTQNSPLRLITSYDPNQSNCPQVYLERYPLFITEELIGYIHFFRTSDEPHLHTHPWRTSYSAILAGGYTETRLKDMTLLAEGKGCVQHQRSAGSFGSLTHQTQHFVTLPQTATGERTCWTLFLHHRNWEYGWGFTENEPVVAKVWDDLANDGNGEYKETSGTLFVTKEKGGGANKKSWWTMEQGPTRFIDKAHILREKYQLSKDSYL